MALQQGDQRRAGLALRGAGEQRMVELQRIGLRAVAAAACVEAEEIVGSKAAMEHEGLGFLAFRKHQRGRDVDVHVLRRLPGRVFRDDGDVIIAISGGLVEAQRAGVLVNREFAGRAYELARPGIGEEILHIGARSLDIGDGGETFVDNIIRPPP